jgi:hypothetical protein
MSKIKINEYHFLQHITAQIKEVHYTIYFAVMFPPQNMNFFLTWSLLVCPGMLTGKT